jgi:F0F1-type ATP synthase membrane subunit c/vacuolar-type H+-ATPase subunit K
VSGPAGEDDPGWRPALGGLAWGLVPGMAIRRARRSGGGGLVVLRGLFLSFCAAIALVGLVVLVLSAGEGIEQGADGTTVAIAVAVAGVVLLVASAWRRPLDGSSEQALAQSYRRRFFLRMAFAEAAALLGFVGFILTGNPAIYLVGAAFTVVGFVLLAPTAGNLARDQEALRARDGTAHSIARALDGGSPPGR